MLRGRLCEQHAASLYRQGLIAGGVYLGTGQEALSAACGLSLQAGDVFAPLIRDGAGRLAFGETIHEYARTYLGKGTGHMRGRDGNIHRGEVDKGMLPMISHLGAMIPTVAGVMLARQLRGESGTIGCASIGDGAMACGATHEGLNAIAVHRLPVVVVVANNRYSYSTPNEQSFACADLVDRAAGYGMPGHSCDGTDPAATLATVKAACDAARAGEGPQLVVASLLRMSGHGEHDDARYVDPALRSAIPDPIERGRADAIEARLISAEDWAGWESELRGEIAAAFAEVEAEPNASPADESWQAYAGDWPALAGARA